MTLKKIFREPLLHFAVLGTLIFILYSVMNTEKPEENSARTIVVDEAALIEFMQNRTRVFEPDAQRVRLQAMSPDEVALLVDDYIREEVFYREAAALGLGEDDYIIKRRMVQKMEFIASAAVAQVDEVSDEDLAAYFEAHRDEYEVAAHISFTHIFFDNERRGAEAAKAVAAHALTTINQDGELPIGDRFPYAKNYIERVKPLVVDHFGAAMADALWKIAPGEAWHGPYESPFGIHLVRVYERREGRLPQLDEVYPLVREDALAAREREAMDRAAVETIEQYDVHIEYAP